MRNSSIRSRPLVLAKYIALSAAVIRLSPLGRRLAQGGQTHRQRHARQRLTIETSALSPSASWHICIRRARAAARTAIRQHDEKFLSAIAAWDILRAQALVKNLPELRQHQIAGIVAVHIIESLEKIDIQHRDRQRRSAALGPTNFTRQGFDKISPIE